MLLLLLQEEPLCESCCVLLVGVCGPAWVIHTHCLLLLLFRVSQQPSQLILLLILLLLLFCLSGSFLCHLVHRSSSKGYIPPGGARGGDAGETNPRTPTCSRRRCSRRCCRSRRSGSAAVCCVAAAVCCCWLQVV